MSRRGVCGVGLSRRGVEVSRCRERSAWCGG